MKTLRSIFVAPLPNTVAFNIRRASKISSVVGEKRRRPVHTYAVAFLFKARRRHSRNEESLREVSSPCLFACLPRPAHLSSRLPLISDKIARDIPIEVVHVRAGIKNSTPGAPTLAKMRAICVEYSRRDFHRKTDLVFVAHIKPISLS